MRKIIYVFGIVGFYLTKLLTAVTIATYVLEWEKLYKLIEPESLMCLLFIYLTLASSGLKPLKK